MAPLEAAALVILLMLPFHWAIQRELRRLADPAYVRSQGVVIAQPSILDAHAPAIGTYLGHEIWASVTFLGMHYRFARVAPRSHRHHVRARELYLEPGLVYVTD